MHWKVICFAIVKYKKDFEFKGLVLRAKADKGWMGWTFTKSLKLVQNGDYLGGDYTEAW